MVWLCGACSGQATPAPPKQSLVQVPLDAPTISEAVAKVAENGLVLVSPGTYRETVTITTPGITLRGTDRNGVIIDGEGIRANDIIVTAPGVTVANLTVRGANLFGLLVTGMPGGQVGGDNPYPSSSAEEVPFLQRFLVDHVTAINNGLYGIYAFVAQHGIIQNSYASGSADSGIYVGQCRDCDILVRGNTAERNAVGFENANASDSVYVVGNRWSGNRIGMTLLTSYQESLRPQRGNLVAGNLISDNTSANSPAQADGGFGIGIGISGGQDNTIQDNRITGNPRAGIMMNNAVDTPASGNTFTDNAYENNGVDIADVSAAQTPSSGNCTDGQQTATIVPDALATAVCPTGSVRSGGASADQLPQVSVPPGLDFLDVPLPLDQPDLADASSTAASPPLPATVGRPDLAEITPPPPDLLAATAGQQ